MKRNWWLFTSSGRNSNQHLFFAYAELLRPRQLVIVEGNPHRLVSLSSLLSASRRRWIHSTSTIGIIHDKTRDCHRCLVAGQRSHRFLLRPTASFRLFSLGETYQVHACHFTSDATPPTATTTTTTIDAMWKQKTSRLINDVLVGSMSANEWSEAHSCILHLLGGDINDDEEKDGAGDKKRLALADNALLFDGILSAINLFDRLFQEEKHLLLPSRTDHEGPYDEYNAMNRKDDINQSNVVPEFFNVELLNLILNRWRQNTGRLRQKKTNMTTNDDYYEYLQPQKLLTKIYRYQEQSIHIQPNAQTFGMVMDGIASIVAENNTSSSSMTLKERKAVLQIVDGIIDRLVNDAIADEEGLEERNNDLSDGDDPSERRESRRAIRPPPAKPNVYVFSAAMNAWVKSGLKDEAPEQVEKLLNLMKDLAERYPNGWQTDNENTSNMDKQNKDHNYQLSNRIGPNRISYSTAIDTWAKVGRVDKVKEILEDMYQTDDDDVRPGLHAFNGLLVALAENGMSDEAEAVLDQIEGLYESGSLDSAPNEFTYTTVLDSFSRSKKRGASNFADAVFRRMRDVAGVKPSVVTYNAVLNAHVKAGNMEAAESLLEEMQADAANTGNVDLRPTIHTYSTLLSGIAKSGHSDAGEKASRILDHLEHLSETGDMDEELDTTLYNTVLDAVARSSYKDIANHANSILQRMRDRGVPRDAITYNTLLRCLGSRDAEKILDIMEEDSVAKNATTYNTLLVSYLSSSTLPKSSLQFNKTSRREQKIALSKATTKAERLFARIKNDPSVELDVISCNTMLHFYALGGDAKKAQKLLEEMQDGSFASVRPDTTTYNTVINAYANSFMEGDDGPEKAESLLYQMMSKDSPAPPPNTATFNSVLSSWVKSRRPEAARHCEKLFQLMKDSPFDCEPDGVTYNTVIHAFASAASEDESIPDVAEEVLAEMKLRSQNGDRWLRPNNLTYGAMIAVWSRCKNRPESGEMAEMYLRQIISNSMQRNDKAKPRVFEFVSTIRAWQNSGDKRAPFKADEIFGLLLHEYEVKKNKQARPNSRLFEVILSIIAHARHVPTKAMYADKMLHLMKKYEIGPNSELLSELEKCYRGVDRSTVEGTV